MEPNNTAVIETNMQTEENETKERKVDIPRSTIDMLEQTFQIA